MLTAGKSGEVDCIAFCNTIRSSPLGANFYVQSTAPFHQYQPFDGPPGCAKQASVDRSGATATHQRERLCEDDPRAAAQKEVEAAQTRVLTLSPQEQLDFWNALNAPVRLTAKQKKLSALMRRKP